MLWRKTYDGMIPCDDESQEWYAKTKTGQIVEMKGNRPRNPLQHRKYFALLGLVVANSDIFVNVDQLRYAVFAGLHLGEWVKVPGASAPLFIPKSMNLASMKQEEFEKVYNDTMNLIIKHWLPADREDIEMQLACA